MDLSKLLALQGDQDKGFEFEIRDPVESRPIGMTITLAGPDSQRQKDARSEMERQLSRAMTSRGGNLTPEKRSKLMAAFLFAVTISWKVTDNGEELPLNEENFNRLLDAGTWLRAQIDSFAADRSPYFRDEDTKTITADKVTITAKGGKA